MKSFAIILAGGQGERFWPMSQPDFPKQFLCVFNDRPLIEQTIERIRGFFRKDEIIIIIPEQLKRLTRKFAGSIPIIVEPVRRNTAPAIGLAAMILKKKYGDGILHIMPADHIISSKRQFITSLRFGERLAKSGYLVTYGIIPDRPETGYGYIKVGKKILERNRISAYNGNGFTEKPSLASARYYLQRGRYLWNSGIFTFSINNILTEMARHIPRAYSFLQKYLKTGRAEYFANIRGISVDYGVMEKSSWLCVVKAPFSWDDVGSWLAMERYFKKDKKGNILVGDTLGLEIDNSIVYTKDIPVRVFGISGLIIVACPRGVLVCRKERAPDLKKLLHRKGG